MKRVDAGFARLLDRHGVDALESRAGTIYGLTPEFRLGYMNSEWFRFADENGAGPEFHEKWGLGASWLDAVSSPFKEFYASKYDYCLRTGTVWTHVHECSSDTVFRRFHQIAYPFGDGDGLLLVHSLIVEMPHPESEASGGVPGDGQYRDDHGTVRQCGHCRRFENLAGSRRWDWIPAWVRSAPGDVRFELCPDCCLHYYQPESKGMGC